jgi:hypothetical protein
MVWHSNSWRRTTGSAPSATYQRRSRSLQGSRVHRELSQTLAGRRKDRVGDRGRNRRRSGLADSAATGPSGPRASWSFIAKPGQWTHLYHPLGPCDRRDRRIHARHISHSGAADTVCKSGSSVRRRNRACVVRAHRPSDGGPGAARQATGATDSKVKRVCLGPRANQPGLPRRAGLCAACVTRHRTGAKIVAAWAYKPA